MPCSRRNPGSSMVILHEMELFYDTPIVYVFLSKCQGLKDNPWRVTLTHYTNDILPNVDGLKTPTAVRNAIGDIEKTRRSDFPMLSFETIRSQNNYVSS